ncbi:MAG TPA: FAD:protein FMN transferase [Solirubrobacteraceae bacterium]|jgi:thiamine biosynthesis lipoprotein
MSLEHETRFHSMGSEIRLLIGAPLLAGAKAPEWAARDARAYVESFAARLSRFREDSELSKLNCDPRPWVPASLLLRTAVSAGIWAARRSGGLVDPTLLGALRDAGYSHSLDRSPPASLRDALEQAPQRSPARADPRERWKHISMTEHDGHGTICRRPGIMLDTGGTGKGLCADALAHRLAGYTRFVVDCGGDIAVGGVGAQLEPYVVEVEHPLTGETICELALTGGGVATSGLNIRVWRTPDGGYAHHLIDPASGRPAWTGLVGATALAPSTLEAETLSKMALLLGPAGAREVLAGHGGLIVHDDGEVEMLGAFPAPSQPSGLGAFTIELASPPRPLEQGAAGRRQA